MNDQLEVIQPEALEILTRAELVPLQDTAREYPRDMAICRQDILEIAAADKDTAASCFFALPRKRKKEDGKGYETISIEGESIRMAEIVAASWQNIKIGKRILKIDRVAGTITAQAKVVDTQKNTETTIEETKSIKSKGGSLYSEDMIIMTGKSAQSVALRNAIFTAIPKAVFMPIFKEIKLVATGAKPGTMIPEGSFVPVPLEDRANIAVNHFTGLGVSEADVFTALGVSGIPEITEDQLAILTGLRTGIKEGDLNLKDAFPPSKGQQISDDISKKIAGNK